MENDPMENRPYLTGAFLCREVVRNGKDLESLIGLIDLGVSTRRPVVLAGHLVLMIAFGQAGQRVEVIFEVVGPDGRGLERKALDVDLTTYGRAEFSVELSTLISLPGMYRIMIWLEGRFTTALPVEVQFVTEGPARPQ